MDDLLTEPSQQLEMPVGREDRKRTTNVLQPEGCRDFPGDLQDLLVLEMKTAFRDLLSNLRTGRESHAPMGVRESSLSA